MPTAFAPGRFVPASSDSGYYFGEDIQAALLNWWRNELVPELRESRSDKSPFELAAVLVESANSPYWMDPLADVVHYLALGDPEDERYAGESGLFRNIAGKLRFTLRTGMPSSYAEDNPSLVLPGDFPYQGAAIHCGFVAAVSGLTASEDEGVAIKLAEKLVELRTPRAKAAIRASRKRTADTLPEIKYLGTDPALSEGSTGFSFGPIAA